MKIEKLDLFKVAPRWLFLKVTTSSGIICWGEPVLEGATGESAGNKFVLPGGGFALLCLDTPDKGNSPTAESWEEAKSFRDNESEETLKQNFTNLKKWNTHENMFTPTDNEYLGIPCDL